MYENIMLKKDKVWI